jgi:hypothetical protein
MSEAYRRARRDKDGTAAGQAIMDAVSGNYSSDAVQSLHHVARMNQTEINAPDIEEEEAQTANVQVNNFFGRGRRKA